jgi:starch-binding outer membrane protein, SusD/RagB family
MKQGTKKYILISILLILASVMFISCKKFLTEKQVSSLTQDYYNNQSGLEALINGLYVAARVKHEWDGNGAKLNDPESDAYMHVDPNFARIASAAYGTDASTIAAQNVSNYLGGANSNYAPMGVYPHINNCNIALDIIDNVKPGKFGTDDAFRRTRRSEILFLRAWAYYLISNQLGDVPLLLTPKREDNGIYNYPKTKLDVVFSQIISDVKYAYENLPPTADRGRLNKWVAGHFLAKLHLNRAQAAGFQNSAEPHLKSLYKGTAATDLDSVITLTTAVINAKGGAAGLAPDYWTLFDPKVSETSPHSEVLWSAQFDINLTLDGRFGGNRSCNYHTGDYTNLTGVIRAQAYGRPFATYKPNDFAYDNFKDKLNDSRYYKSFQYEYISNAPTLATSNSYTWSAGAATWWNANKPPTEPAVTAGSKRILPGARALIFIENQRDEALDSAAVMSQPYQFMVRWVRSATSNRYYYRLFHTGANMGLATGIRNIYLSSKKYVDPLRGGSADEANFNSESGTRDAILMRLAETFLIRAEAYGRKNQYNLAVADINVVRQRAAFKNGEARPKVAVEWEPDAGELAPSEKVPPYTANGTSYGKITVTENHFTPGTAEATGEGYIPTVTTKDQMFIHFIYNEKGREFLSEGLAWEDLHNAGLLYDRVIYLNQMASDRAGLWPVASNTDSGNGQDGNGKGQYKKHHTFRPWPNGFLVQLTDESGKLLDAAAKAAYQNPGY